MVMSASPNRVMSGGAESTTVTVRVTVAALFPDESVAEKLSV